MLLANFGDPSEWSIEEGGFGKEGKQRLPGVRQKWEAKIVFSHEPAPK